MGEKNGQAAEKQAQDTVVNDDLVVEASGVVKVYHTGTVDVPALRGVDLSVRRGEMVAIMGPSGSGKTTLLNCLSGLDTADQGQISIEGVSLLEMTDVVFNHHKRTIDNKPEIYRAKTHERSCNPHPQHPIKCKTH